MRPLLLWHGWGMHPTVWSILCNELAEQHGIAAPKQALPGYDQSDEVEPHSLDTLVDAMLPATTAVTLCGWSLGALLAMHAARRYPQRVARLILISATPSFVNRQDWVHGMLPAVLDEFIIALANDPIAARKRFIALSNQNDIHARTISHTMLQILSATSLPSIRTLIAGLTLLRNTDLRAYAADIAQPTLLLHGARDSVMPVAAAQWLLTAMPQAQLELLPDAAHSPFLSDPVRCAVSIANFSRG